MQPSETPTESPTMQPTQVLSLAPTESPTMQPSETPTESDAILTTPNRRARKLTKTRKRKSGKDASPAQNLIKLEQLVSVLDTAIADNDAENEDSNIVTAYGIIMDNLSIDQPWRLTTDGIAMLLDPALLFHV